MKIYVDIVPCFKLFPKCKKDLEKIRLDIDTTDVLC